ncbi:protein kinase domain-containing protein [Terrabacter sp. 2RAF25]|uniref:protein kinase domain-containing protein n=1 Tax=Terrabacter sp. 2RAF25 TaxID=3232998 RepID=UPI003F9EAC69
MSVDSSAAVRLAQRYTLRERIAVGGMGEVHLATDDRLGRVVAVKVLAPAVAHYPESVERFRREATTAAALSHPNIAQVYDYGVDGSSHFIVMEHVDGSDLSRLLRQVGRLTPSDAVRIAEQVCSALAAAHRAGVVHRDIKPGNVIVRPDGAVKVTDFGIAQALGQASLTDTGTVMGTAAYVSPEQARGQATSPATDIYSLGILLFQMLTGSVPFDGDTPVAIAMRHLDEPIPLPSSRVHDLPADLDDVVLRATAKVPSERYADADAMAMALARREPGADAATRALPAGEATSVLAVDANTARMPALGVPSAPVAAAAALATSSLDTRSATSAGDPPPTGLLPTGEQTSADTRTETQRSRRDGGRRRGPGVLVWALVAVVLALVATLGFVLLSGSGTDAAGPAAPQPKPTASTTAAPSPSATGPQPSDGGTVPTGLVGAQRGAAVDALIKSGVNVRWVLVRSTKPEDTVLGTFPAEGQPMTKGQTVALVVSRGHAPAASNTSFVVPDGLVGTDAKKAMSRLEKEDVRVTRVTVPGDSRDQVVGTWPSAGQPTADGVVVLVVAGGGDKAAAGDNGNGNGNGNQND